MLPKSDLYIQDLEVRRVQTDWYQFLNKLKNKI